MNKMTDFLWRQTSDGAYLSADGRDLLAVPALEGCTDTFESIGEGAWRWTRVSAAPVTHMRMTVRQLHPVTYWQIPGVNYNGNGWGKGAQYSGFRCGDEPWVYAWHRVAIPACTYAEQGEWAVSLFGEEAGGMSCSIYDENDCVSQQLIWPETEGPKVLSKRCWMEKFEGTMAPADTFTGILFVNPVERPGRGYQRLLDFAWKYFERPVKMPWQPEELIKLDVTFFRQLWHKRPDGLTGFSKALYWNEVSCQFVRKADLQIGWVGQNASVSCTLLREYIKTGEKDLLEKAISALDTWVKYARLPNGLFYVDLVAPPMHLDSVDNGTIPLDLDACNLGTGATYLFKAGRLCKEAGIERPEYTQMALDFCDFAVNAQCENGEFAKTYFIDGSIDVPHGSVGAFMILPLYDAYELTGEKKYLECALKAFAFYNGEFQTNGFTTAGALDSYCIDKESAAPLLRAAVRAYDLTGEKKYVDWAEDIAYYLNTWLWHYSIDFPEGSVLKEIGYDAYGGTSVSAAHNAQDPYGLYYVPEYLRLAELTGREFWLSCGRALWYNGIERISDGTLVIEGRVRPYGSQDESCRHTRWGRTDLRYHVTSGNVNPWPGAFREVALDLIPDWTPLRTQG